MAPQLSSDCQNNESRARALAEGVLRKSEERFRKYFELGLIGMVITSPTKGCLEVNDRLCEILGYQRAELLQKTWAEMTHPDDLVADTEQLNRVVEGAIDRYSSEKRWIRKDGRVVNSVISVSCVRCADGSIDYFVALLEDITERKVADAALRDALAATEAARAEAERANRLLHEFFARASHELRGPLAAMTLWLDALRDDCPRERARAVDAIDRSVQQQSRLVGDLLDMARGLSGKLRIEREQVNLTNVVRAALEEAEPVAPGVMRKFVAPAQHVWVQGDGARLQQAVTNLVSNACKFSDDRGRVEVRLAREGKHAVISVHDQGRGISPSFLPHVFAPFQQADTSLTRSHGGLGLGLAIVKQIVELHDGKVGVASAGEDRGSMFLITLPCIEPPREDASPEMPHAVRSVRGIRVLIIDDDELVRAGLSRVLAQRGAAVTTAASASEAWEVFVGRRFDVLVCDIAMPDEDGYSLLRRIRTLPTTAGGQTPAMALSGQARAEDRAAALAAGFQEHVAKPVPPSDLAAILAQLADRHGRDASAAAG